MLSYSLQNDCRWYLIFMLKACIQGHGLLNTWSSLWKHPQKPLMNCPSTFLLSPYDFDSCLSALYGNPPSVHPQTNQLSSAYSPTVVSLLHCFFTLGCCTTLCLSSPHHHCCWGKFSFHSLLLLNFTVSITTRAQCGSSINNSIWASTDPMSLTLHSVFCCFWGIHLWGLVLPPINQCYYFYFYILLLSILLTRSFSSYIVSLYKFHAQSNLRYFSFLAFLAFDCLLSLDCCSSHPTICWLIAQALKHYNPSMICLIKPSSHSSSNVHPAALICLPLLHGFALYSLSRARKVTLLCLCIRKP